jgi:hypothetical protein
MPAYPWLVHFPDDDLTVLAPRRDLPRAGDELLAGWIVTDHKTPKRKARHAHVDVWVTSKDRPRIVRQRTDRL